MPSTNEALVSLVGLPERQYRGRHPGGSRYEAFRHHIPASLIWAPQARRFYSFCGGWRIDALVEAYTRPEWSVGAALLEASAALHMLTKRGRVYHAVRGEGDLCFLPRVARRTGNYLVASFHEEPHTIGYYLDERRIAEQLHGAILLGEVQRSYLAKYLPPERIFVVHHSVDTDFFRPADNDPTEPLCVTVGAHMRDAKTLAAAMKRVWRVNPNVRLIAIGTRPGYEQDESAVPKLNDDRLVLLDRIPDAELLRVYQASSVAILSVNMSVANNALLEQMACGLPVVATDVGAVREYLGDEAGLLFPPGDAEALAAGVLKLLEDEPARRRMGAAARSRALGFDHRVAAQQFTQVYRRVKELG